MSIIQSLVQEDMYVERLAERLGVSAPTVSFHLKKLIDAGFVQARKEQYYTMYSICKETLSFNVLDIIAAKAVDDDTTERDKAYRQGVLNAFFKYGKLKTIPAQLKKRAIILEEICKSFEAGRDYTEKEVNLIIADFYDDFATIRRAMIEFGLMKRNNGIYRTI
ncbi:MAG: DUF2087 domain-containing protein [Defluviitaleaceae bacterium]|nr:DUF2087 domain-containing protein [Defluviitaleaceae bacterium]